MKKYNKMMITTILSIAGLFTASEPAYADQAIRKTRAKSVVFAEIIPSKGDLIRIDHDFRVRNKGKKKSKQMNKPKRVYGVKIYAELPQTSMAIDLYVGDILIGEYYSFNEGIFFKIYGDDALERHYGKPIRFVFNKTGYDLDVSFPSEKETLPFKQNSEQTKVLPKLKEFLDG
ncbi:MAG: hypothetical protein L3J79_09825 [Candidatus Marinimicrobia bacterium]|nr:hypothetical protein [Candidatus Neomarinimicrobiota bacterium]